MKQLAMCLFLLLCAAPAIAQSPQDVLLMQCAGQYVYCHTDGSGDVYGRDTLKEQWRVLGAEKPVFVPVESDGFRTIFNTCENIMEQAMGAMDRFVQGMIISKDRAETVWQPGAQRQFNAAKVQWDAAMRSCWKEKP